MSSRTDNPYLRAISRPMNISKAYFKTGLTQKAIRKQIQLNQDWINNLKTRTTIEICKGLYRLSQDYQDFQEWREVIIPLVNAALWEEGYRPVLVDTRPSSAITWTVPPRPKGSSASPAPNNQTKGVTHD